MILKKYPFAFGFNKKEKFLLNEEIETYSPIKEREEKARQNIEKYLGKKEKYDTYEVCKYFAYKYGAVQIPFRYEMIYRDTTNFGFSRFTKEMGYSPNEVLCYDEYFKYCDEPKENEEEVIALLIDLYNNRWLEEEYPIIKKEKQRIIELKKEKDCDYIQFNAILTIGSFDKKTINSMTIIDGITKLDDLYYDIYYFYKHS